MLKLNSRLNKFYLQKIKGLALPKDLIRYSVNRHRDKIAVIDQDRQITYGALYERAMKLANALTGLGLNKGDKLGVLLYNCREYFEIRIASYFTGIVLVPIVWDMDPEDIIFILNDCDVKCLVYHPEILGGNLEKIKQKTAVKDYIPISQSKRDCFAMTYEGLIADKTNTVEPKIKIELDDLASINFSSGTTGRPKGIMLTHGNWANSFYNFILNSPMARAYGLIALHILPFSTAGGTMFLPACFFAAVNIVMKEYNLEEAIRLVEKHGVNAFFASPSIFIDLLDYCKYKKKKPVFLGITIGTEGMPQAKYKEAINYFGPIIQRGYGMAEVLPPLTLLCSKDYYAGGKLDETKLAFVGKALQGVIVKTEAGKIVISSPTRSKGYWHNPELTKAAYRSTFFYSNDFGHITEDGYVSVLGRKEDIVKEDGKNIYFASEIEEILHGHPAVLLVYVFKDEDGRIIATVSLKRGQKNIGSEDLRGFCEAHPGREGLPVPDIFKVVPEIPVRATGKIDRNKIKGF